MSSILPAFTTVNILSSTSVSLKFGESPFGESPKISYTKNDKSDNDYNNNNDDDIDIDIDINYGELVR